METPKKTSLPVVTIHTPCPKQWAELNRDSDGDPRRFCDHCAQHVYDFSALRDHEIESLMSDGEKVCARILYHADGSIVSRDRPIEASPIRRSRFHRLKVAAAILGLLFLSGCDRLFPKSEPEPHPVDLTTSEILGKPAPQEEIVEELGDVAYEENIGGASAPPPEIRGRINNLPDKKTQNTSRSER